MTEELPKDLSRTDKLDPTQPIGAGDAARTPQEGRFASLMQENTQNVNQAPSQVNGPSPMEIQANRNVGAPPTLDSVQNQMRATSDSLGDIKNQLHNKGLKLKQSQKYLLRNKLSQANEHIRSAAEHVGAKTTPPPDLSGRKNPIAKFLDLVADGQEQMKSASEEVNRLNSSGESINTGQLLLVQVKLQKAQQELEYTSVILGKAVEIIKTLFNVQI